MFEFHLQVGLSKDMMTYWANFAKTGEPVAENDGFDYAWNEFSDENSRYLDISQSVLFT